MKLYLSEVSTLGTPHWRGAQTKDDGAGDESVELWVELGADVGGVTEHGKDHGPLDGQLLDDERGQEHA